MATAALGPRRPNWIDTWPQAALTISFGMVNAETLSGPFSKQPRVLRFDLVKTADAGAEDDTAAKRVLFSEIETRVVHGVDAGDHGELRKAVEPLRILG